MLRSDNRLQGSALVPSSRWLTAIAATAGLLLALQPGDAKAAPGAAHAARHKARHKVLLGDPKLEPLRYSLAPGRSEAFRLRAHASGRVSRLKLYVGATSSARAVLVGLYRDTHHRPGALLASGAITAPRRGGWNTLSLTPLSHISAGKHYWLTILAEGGTLDYRARRRGRCPRASSVQANLSALPATTSAVRIRRHAHCPISAYATKASTGSPGAPVNLTVPVVVAGPPGSNPLAAGTSLGPASPLTKSITKEEQTRRGKEGESTPPHEEESTPPPAAPANSGLPSVGGALAVGDVLTSTPGTWSGDPTSYSYRWQDCNSSGANCKAIAGASSASYTLAATDVAHTIRVIVTATNTDGSTSATSKQTGAVKAAVVTPPPPPPPPPAAPTNIKAPTISGATTQGQALSASKGSWTESPTSYAYRWQDCNSSGASCTDIAGATASSYTLTESDVGHALRVVVTATNGAGSTPATSNQSAIVAAYTGGSSYPKCTQTISQGANVASTVSGAAAGSVICLSSGAYGNLSLSSSHSADVTVQAGPGAHVTAGEVDLAGSHIVVRGLWIDGEVALEKGASFMTIDRDDITGGGEGIVFDTSDCTVPGAPTWAGCEPQAPITDVTISHNHLHDIGETGGEDAIHLDNWRRVSITGNEFDHIVEAGDHTDCVQSVYGGDQLTFDHNYEHDNDCQGFFIKDGDATNVAFTDNLFLRDQIGTYANFAQIWNIQNLTIQHNTIWDGKGLALVTEDASFTPTVTMDHNVVSNMSVEPHSGPAYVVAEGQDIFGEAPNKMSMGSGDSVMASPKFTNTATDDYRLASNPGAVGIDWSPVTQQYGPAS